jgi:hypothetical protein
VNGVGGWKNREEKKKKKKKEKKKKKDTRACEGPHDEQ